MGVYTEAEKIVSRGHRFIPFHKQKQKKAVWPRETRENNKMLSDTPNFQASYVPTAKKVFCQKEEPKQSHFGVLMCLKVNRTAHLT